MFFEGCSNLWHRQKISKPSPIPETELQKLCWNSEGRARFEAAGERHLVTFFSEMLSAQTLWRLGIQIPMKGEEVIELDYVKRQAIWPGLKGNQLSRDKQFAAWQSLIEALSDFLSLSVKHEPQCHKKETSGVWSCTVLGTDRQYDVKLGDGQLLIEGQWGGDIFKLKASQLEEEQNYYQMVEVQQTTKQLTTPLAAKFFIKECRQTPQ